MPKDSHEKTVSARKILAVSLALALLVFGIIYTNGRSEAPSNKSVDCNSGQSLEVKTMQQSSQTITVEVASTTEHKVQGLSGRNCLEPDKGMLFAYDEPGDYCYWMKDMNFSIDMLWLDKDQKVLTLKNNVSPSTYPESFCPDSPAYYVLEVPAGFSDESGWYTGTQFSIQ